MPLILLPSLIPTTSPCYHWMPSDEVSANKHTVQRLKDWIYSKALPLIISSSVSCWWSPTLLRSKDAPNEREALWNELGPPLAPAASMPTSSLSRLHQPPLIIRVQATVHTSTSTSSTSLFRIRQLRASESNLFKSRRKMLTIWPRRDKSRWSHCRFLLIACWENEMLASQAQIADVGERTGVCDQSWRAGEQKCNWNRNTMWDRFDHHCGKVYQASRPGKPTPRMWSTKRGVWTKTLN